MIPTPEQAEAQLRAIIEEADLQDERLDTFRASLPTMRASDLFGYITDRRALETILGVLDPTGRSTRQNSDTVSENSHLAQSRHRRQLVIYAALFAVKDQIDLRFPIHAAGEPSAIPVPRKLTSGTRIRLMFEHPACEIVVDVHLPLADPIVEGADAMAARVCPACPICKERLGYVGFNLDPKT